MSIGARSQSAKTYLEKHYEEFANGKQKKRNNNIMQKKLISYTASLEELVRHGLQALRDTLQQDKELNINNTSLGIVGEDREFEIVEGDALQHYLDLLGEETGRTRLPVGVSAAESVAAESARADASNTATADLMDTSDA
jgi:20S proteasome subunit alpha 6